MRVCTLQQKPWSAEQIQDGTEQAATVAVVQKSSPGVIASHQLNMIQQHPVPEKKPEKNVVMECMNRNVICKIHVMVPLVVAESLSWNMVSSCGQCTSWKIGISWRWPKSNEKGDRMDDWAGFRVMGEVFSNQLEVGAKKERNTFSHCCR